ncbi:MAG: hypothetical protein V4772_24350 [Pseudomonadota bacterium]
MSTCVVCGAEESLDGLLLRMIDDDQVRRLIAEVITTSLPLGGLVVRYLRLHKPAKQRLRMSLVGKLLGELLQDMRRGSIERVGRAWPVNHDNWLEALQSVFEAHDKGTLVLPLQGNGYLYQCMARIADREEGSAEQALEQERRQMAVARRDTVTVRGQALPIGAALQVMYAGKDMELAKLDAGPLPVPPAPVQAPAGPRVDSPLVRQMKAELAAKKAGQR